MLLIFLLLFAYINLGMGMYLMVCFTNQHAQIESLLGENYSLKILYTWPWFIKKIVEHYYR